MSPIIPVLLALAATTVSAGLLSLLEKTTGIITSELATAVSPVEQIGIGVLSSQCTLVKRILRADYNQSSPPDLSELTLNLYTREANVVFNLSTAAVDIPMSPWFKNQTKVIIFMHGFIDNPSSSTFQSVNAAFLAEGDYYVLALNSSSLLGLSTLYIGATTNVRYIGEILGAVLANMTAMGASPSSMYLIGHSLGAHIAGFAGKTLTTLTGFKVARITGLDPAGPCFASVDSGLKLNSTDADFVDVIHSNAGVFGLDEQIGHTDYYPNAGSVQPGCNDPSCDHSRAWMFYAETVVGNTMPGVGCDSWKHFEKDQCNSTDISEMGYGCDPSTRGTYYLQTNASSPYSRGTDGLAYDGKGGLVRTLYAEVGLI